NKVSRKIDQKADRAIDKALDKGEKEIDEEVNETVKGEKKEKKKGSDKSVSDGDENSNPAEDVENNEETFIAYSKFDFIPGEKVIFYDDFSMDNIGDFPAKWNTNGSGEVVTTSDNAKWFELKGNSIYIPLMEKSLQENYTIEFDLNSSELDNKLSSQTYLQILLDDNE